MLGISVETVRRDLRLGQAFLQRELMTPSGKVIPLR
jgi:DNA-directed RNA polymerase specialized sigma24 family protein